MRERYENWKDLKPLTAPVSIGTRCVCLVDYFEFKCGDIVQTCDTYGICPECIDMVGNHRDMEIHELAMLPSEEPAKVERKIVQIATDPRGTTALCNDGTLWYNENSTNRWSVFPPIPQDAV